MGRVGVFKHTRIRRMMIVQIQESESGTAVSVGVFKIYPNGLCRKSQVQHGLTRSGGKSSAEGESCWSSWGKRKDMLW